MASLTDLEKQLDQDVANDSPPPGITVNTAELVKLGAVDTEFFNHTFFPKTFRQKSPAFAPLLNEPLENPAARMVNLMVFRGAGKTTRLRAFAAKRISYGISRTILYIGASERDAIRGVMWIRNNIVRNRFWAQTFNLHQGSKWDETQIEIEHRGFGHTVWVLGAGITGSLRGINFDDYRPDLIILDDPQTDEMAATEEQRTKVSDLVFGAVKNSLAPETEEPNAKLVMSITPQHKDDIGNQALKDEQWVSRVFPCWTQKTLHVSNVDNQVSSWPERFPSEVLRQDKKSAVKRNKLSLFAREMECRIIASEKTHFQTSWLQVRDFATPRGCYAVLAIDPVPPPSNRQIAKGFQGKDFEAHYVWGRDHGNYHLLDCDRSRGHDPSWTIATAFRLARQWRVSRIVVDAVAYQRTLKWILEREMQRTGIWYTVVPVADGMKKYTRITSVLNPLATSGRLWIGPEHTEFATQFEEYGPLYTGHDDDLDASALALEEMSSPFLEGSDPYANDDANVEQIEFVRNCP